LPGEIHDIARKVANYFAPESDASATNEYYEINVELPGISQDDVDVSVHEHVLTIKGEKHVEHEEKGKTYFFSERAFGTFQRSFRLPPDSVGDKIEANFKDGLLNIRVPKSGPTPESARKIEIKSG
jgi:HSP20 family protein